MHGKVLDIDGGNRSPGARVIIWPRKPHREDNQLWYTDEYGIIRSMLNDFAMDATSGKMLMQPYDPQNSKKQWMFQGNKVVNRTNPREVLDICGVNYDDGAEVGAWNDNGQQNQHFAMDHA